jgi:predicted nucleic-acid-binding Zn-ribbon protein
MSSKQVEPNKWYFVVDCAKCRENIPFLEAPSPEEQPDIKQRTIGDLKCPHCGHTDIYAPALMYRAQGPEK